MPRDTTRSRSQLGGGGKTSPKIKDVDTQRAVSEIYKELNALAKSVNSVANLSQSVPSEGRDGDIRLYVDYAEDGSKGYFVQGKFGDSWASGRLSFDSVDPKQQKSVVNRANSYEQDGGGYITAADVTYGNLDNNQDVGPLTGQVAKGNHNHDHQTLIGHGTNDHNAIDGHLSNLTKHRLANDDDSKYINTVSSTGNDSGEDDTWARSDHVHTLNQAATYTFTAKQNIDRGNSNLDGLYVRGKSDFVGDVSIDGNLTVDFAENSGGNTTIDQNLDVAGNVTAGQNVALNDKSSELSNNINDTSTTTIHGKSYLKNSLEVLKALGAGEKHFTLASDNTNKIDVSVSGTGVVNFEGNNAFRFNQKLEPELTLTSDLGSQSKKWRTLYVGELIANTLVAQSVMATIGGRIMVAPTTVITEDIAAGNSMITISVKHKIFEHYDILFMQSAPGGIPQTEAMRVLADTLTADPGPYEYVVARNINNDGGGNAWSADDAAVNLGHKQGDGFIDITATQSVYNNEGPMIGMFSRPSTIQGTSDWNVPEIARLGNLSGTGYTGNDDFGIMIGKNLEYSHTHGTFPFTGMIGNQEGLKMYNTDISLYDGDDLTAFIGKDSNNRPVFALGNDMGSEFSDSSLLYKWDQSLNGGNGKYKLTLSNTDVDLGVDIAISENSIIDAMPWFTADPGGLADDTEGLYLSSKWLGFYENPAGNGSADTYWPIIIGSTGTGANLEPFFEIKNAPTYPTEYLRYTVANGLEISGKVNILGQQPAQVLEVYSNIQADVSLNNAVVDKSFVSSVTGKIYAHFRVKDASNGKIQFTNAIGGDVPTFIDVLTNLSGTGSLWYTAEIELTGSNGLRAFRWRNVGNDNTPHIVEDLVITRDMPGDPHAILYADSAPSIYYQTTAPTGVFDVGDQWIDITEVDDVPKNDLWVWNGTAWEATFTAIDGGQITTGTIKGVAVESTETFTNNANAVFPRSSLDMGSTNKLKQYATGVNPARYTELDGGTLKYVHEHTSGGGVENSTEAQKLVYELPRAMQIIRAADFNLGFLNTFSSLNLTNMYSSDYQVIPIPKTTIATGQQAISDLNNTNGIAREQVHYDVDQKSKTGFRMKAKLFRGDSISLAGNGNFTSDDDADTLTGNATANGNPQGGPYPQSPAPAISSSYFNGSYDVTNGQYTYAEGNVNTNTVGGVNKFLYKFKIHYHELCWQNTFDFGGTPMTSYVGFPGTTTFYFMLRVGDGTGSPFVQNSMFHTVTPIGYGGDHETDDLKIAVTNTGGSALSDVYDTGGSDGTSGEDYWGITRQPQITVTWNSPGNVLVTNPRIELICFRTQRENQGSINGYGYHSPHVNDSSNGIYRLDVKHGQDPQFVEEIQGQEYVGALVADGLNISS